MNRRSFLGSVIGLLTIQRLPFIAEEVPRSLKVSIDEFYNFLLRGKVGCRMALDIDIAHERKWIEGKIIAVENNEANKFSIIHEPVLANTEMVLYGAKLLMPDGREISRRPLERPEWLAPTDILKPRFNMMFTC